MNRYLEKIAFKITPIHTGIAGAVAGAAAGGYLGHKPKTQKAHVGFFKTTEVPKNEALRVVSGISGAMVGGLYGGIAGLYAHPGFRREMKNARSERYYRDYGRSSGSAGNERTSRTIHDIHNDLGKPGGFKTKTEAASHFRKTRSQYHPDKHPGKEKEMNDRMATLNRAWDEFQAHPEGFTKLANAYLTKIAGINFTKVKNVLQNNPLAATGGVLLGAEGLSSTTRKKNEHMARYRLRQLKNTALGVGTGAFIGKTVQEGLKKVSD